MCASRRYKSVVESKVSMKVVYALNSIELSAADCLLFHRHEKW